MSALKRRIERILALPDKRMHVAKLEALVRDRVAAAASQSILDAQRVDEVALAEQFYNWQTGTVGAFPTSAHREGWIRGTRACLDRAK